MSLTGFAIFAFTTHISDFASAQDSDTHCGTSTLPRCTEAEINLTNKWSATTTDPEASRGIKRLLADPPARRYSGDDTFLYATAREFHSSGTQLNSIHKDADILVVTLHDEDRNLPVPVVGESNYLWEAGSGTGNVRSFFVANDPGLPIVDYSNDGRIGAEDLSVTTISGAAELGPSSAFNWESGGVLRAYVTVFCYSHCDQETLFTIGWNTSRVDEVTVRVSATNGRGGTLTLTETGIDTGTFEGEVYITDALSPFMESGRRTFVNNRERLTIAAVHASRVTVSYTDRVTSRREESIRARALVDIEPPDVFVSAPEHNFSLQDERPDFRGYFDDSGAGLLISSANLYIDTSNDADNHLPVLNFDDFKFLTAEPPIRDGVVKVRHSSLRLNGTRDGSISEDWRHRGTELFDNTLADFVARIDDLAGNIGFSDAVPEEFGTQPHLLSVASEPPKIVADSSISGEGWNSSRQKISADERRSIKLVFDSPLDPVTITPEDFVFTDTISSKILTAAAVLFPELPPVDYLSPPNERSAVNTERQLLRRTVFIRFSDDLPSHGELKVEIVGAIADLAGNVATAQNSQSVTTADGIPPLPTISLGGGSGLGDDAYREGGASLTNNRMDILISTDERIRRPNLQFTLTAENDNTFVGFGEAVNIRRDVGNAWRASFTHNLLSSDADGEVTVTVSAEDYSGNTACLYSVQHTPTDPVSSCDYAKPATVKFTLDKTPPVLSNPRRVTLSTGVPVVAEWNEKVRDLNVSLSVQGGEESDISQFAETSDNERFFWTSEFNLSFGTHTLEASAADMAGNRSENMRQVIEIIEHKPFRLTMFEGWNAISLPSTPISTAIESVFAGSPITSVLSYETWRTGENWRTAFRNGESWAGNLKEINGGIGYLVRSSSYGVVEIPLSIPGASVPDTPPSIPLFNGWNFIGVSSANVRDIVSESGEPLHIGGSEISANISDYLSLPYLRAYLTSSDGDAVLQTPVSPEDEVPLGGAFWVYLSSAGTDALALSPP